MGFIPVYFRNEVRWARPVLNTHEIRIPTKEWISKYGDSLGIYVQESIIEGISTLWWLGFCLFENNSLNAEFDDEYPYLKILHFDESWIELCSSKENKRRWEIKSLETDYSSLKIDSSNKIFSLNNRTINGIHFSKDETIILEDKLLSLGAFGYRTCSAWKRLKNVVRTAGRCLSCDNSHNYSSGIANKPSCECCQFCSIKSTDTNYIKFTDKIK